MSSRKVQLTFFSGPRSSRSVATPTFEAAWAAVLDVTDETDNFGFELESGGDMVAGAHFRGEFCAFKLHDDGRHLSVLDADGGIDKELTSEAFLEIVDERWAVCYFVPVSALVARDRMQEMLAEEFLGRVDLTRWVTIPQWGPLLNLDLDQYLDPNDVAERSRNLGIRVLPAVRETHR